MRRNGERKQPKNTIRSNIQLFKCTGFGVKALE